MAMNYRLVIRQDKKYIECLPGEQLLDSEREALDLVVACGENETDRLMVHADNLPEAFFRLSTGLAGAIFLKFNLYRIRFAAVLTPELVGDGRFKELVWESNRGSEFRVFYDRQKAEDWLLAE